MAEEAMALAAAALPPPVPLLVRVPGHGVRMWDTAGSRPSVGDGVPAAAVAGRSAGALAAGQPDALGSSGAVNSRDPDGGRSKSMAAAAAASQPALLQPTSAALYPAGAGYSVGNSAAGPSSSGSCRVQPLDLPSCDLSSGWEAEWQDGLGFPPPQLEADEALGGGAPAPAAASSLVPPGCVPAGGSRLGVPSPPSDRMDVLSWLCEGTHELLAGQPDLSNLEMLGDTVLVVLWQPSSARVDASGTRRTVRRLAGGAAGATDGSGAFLLLHLTCHHQLLVWRAAGRGGAAAAAAAGGSGGAADGGVSDGGRRLAPLVSVTPKQAESLGESCLARLPAGTAVIVTTNVTSGGYRQHVAPHYMFDPSRTAGGQVQGQGQGSACGAIALARLLRVGPPTRLGASGDGGRVGDLRVPVLLDKTSFMWVPFKRYSDLVMDLGFSETIQSQVRRVGQDPLRQRLYTGAGQTVELMQQRHQQRHQQRKQEQGQRQERRQVQHQEQRQQQRQQLQQQGAAAAASGAAAAPSAPTTAAYAAGGGQPRLLEPLHQSLAPYVGGIHFLAAQAAAAITAARGHGAASGDRSSSAPAATPLGLVGARPATMLPPQPSGPLLPPRPPPAAAAGAAGQAGSFSRSLSRGPRAFAPPAISGGLVEDQRSMPPPPRPPPPPAPAHLLREGWGAAAASAAAAGLGLAGVPVYGNAMRALHNLQQKEEQRRHLQERRQAGSGVQGLAEPSEQPPVADMLSETTICPRQRAQTVVETHAMPAAASGAGSMVAGAAQPLAGCSKPGLGGAAAAAAQPAGGWRLPDGSSSGGGGRGGLATAAGPSHPVPAALGAVHAAAAAGAHAGMQAELCDSGGGRGSSQSGASACAPCGQDLDSAAAAALVAAAVVYQRPASRNDTSSTPAATPLGLVGARPATMLPPQPSGPLLPPRPPHAAAAGAAGQAGSFSRSLSRGPRAFAPPAISSGLVEDQRSMPPPPRPPPPPAPAHLLREGWGAAAASAAAAGLGLAGVPVYGDAMRALHNLQQKEEQRRHLQERRQAGSGVQGLAEPSEQPPVADMLSETTICPRQRAQTVVETHAMPAAASGAGSMVAGAAQPLAGCSKPGPGGAAAAAAQPAGGWRLPDGSSSGGGGRGGLATAAGPSHPVPAALGAVHAAAAAGAHAGMQAELCDSGGGRGSSQSGASARAPCGQDLDSAAAAALVAAAVVYQRPASRNDTSSTPAATPLGLVGARPATMLPLLPPGPLLPPRPPPAAAAGAAGQAGSFSRSLSRGPRAFAPPAISSGLVEDQRSMPPPPRPPPPPAPAHLLREGWGAAAASAAAAGLGLAGVDRIAMLEAVLYLLQREREAEEERALREPGDVALAAARSESC
ncbi:hypothetical protein HYH02_015416 [Chlamydomonas schloesseri]|uniref:Uncharacterized protein n=1 Tax=Chlamydomonas schloesseri TaxID=2026947 RepID=A0A835SLF8_9CHLO|nr:hypothetical protein HYH02_015416 [Chlamydomonas schloesseri]|eukprot:KAG2422570.1 hypothetical protein HYH02_015416 [Chlamydomonas schloesseri]